MIVLSSVLTVLVILFSTLALVSFFLVIICESADKAGPTNFFIVSVIISLAVMLCFCVSNTIIKNSLAYQNAVELDYYQRKEARLSCGKLEMEQKLLQNKIDKLEKRNGE